MNWVRILMFLMSFWVLERFCHKQTAGFKVGNVISKRFEQTDAPFLSEDEHAQLKQILAQPFTFLGSGGQAYAFLSQDGKTVLKLFKHHHLHSFAFLKALPLPNFLLELIDLREKQRTAFFQSCTLAYEDLKEETGLLYLQLSKTTRWQQKVTVIDKLGIAHQLDLDKLEFALQKKANLAIRSVKKLMQLGKKEEAKEAISAILEHLAKRSQKGIQDNDTGLRRNMGFEGKQAMAIDIGSFSKEPKLKEHAHMEKELQIKTVRLARYLEDNDQELSMFYKNALQKAVEQNSVKSYPKAK